MLPQIRSTDGLRYNTHCYYVHVKPLLLCLLTATLSAQQIIIDSGSATDKYYAGGSTFTSPALSAVGGVYKDLRSGASFDYDVPVVNGTCTVRLDLIEPRAAVPEGATPASATGTRMFTVTVNGTTTPIDIFALAGALTPVSLPLPPVTVLYGSIHLHFAATLGNAVLSGLAINCTPPPVPPLSLDPATGQWTFNAPLKVVGDLKATGTIENGADSTLPATVTLRMLDGSRMDGVSGQYRLGSCDVTVRAGWVVKAACF